MWRRTRLKTPVIPALIVGPCWRFPTRHGGAGCYVRVVGCRPSLPSGSLPPGPQRGRSPVTPTSRKSRCLRRRVTQRACPGGRALGASRRTIDSIKRPRLIIPTGFFVSAFLLLVGYLDRSSHSMAIFGALTAIFFVLFLRMPRRR